MKLAELLAHHTAADAQEHADLDQMRRFAAELARPFARDQWPAHFTGSAVVVTADGSRVCLVLHATLKRWLQPGGHAEPADEGSMERSALREAREETGLDVQLHPTAPRPLDVDVHVIPQKKAEPEHRHLDVRFLVVASNPDALQFDPNESSGARWRTWDEALHDVLEPASRRMLEKARAIMAP